MLAQVIKFTAIKNGNSKVIKVAVDPHLVNQYEGRILKDVSAIIEKDPFFRSEYVVRNRKTKEYVDIGIDEVYRILSVE